MPELRWILLLAGAILIAFLYAWGRRAQNRDTDDEVAPEVRREPDLGDLASQAGERREPQVDEAEPAQAAERPAATPSEPESSSAGGDSDKVVTLHLIAADKQGFDAQELVAALRAEGLRYGRFEIFHRYNIEGNPGPDTPPQFSVANMFKPGTFELDDLGGKRIKGATMFFTMPGPGDPVTAFADMLATGRRLAATIKGQLVDTGGSHVSRQSAAHMREELINYQHGLPAPHE